MIPANLERDILRGHPAKLVLLGNGAYLGRASWVLGSVADALGAFGRDAVVGQAAFMGAPQAPPVTLVQRPCTTRRKVMAAPSFPAWPS